MGAAEMLTDSPQMLVYITSLHHGFFEFKCSTLLAIDAALSHTS